MFPLSFFAQEKHFYRLMNAGANEVTSLDAAMTIFCHVGRRRRGASEFFRYA